MPNIYLKSKKLKPSQIENLRNNVSFIITELGINIRYLLKGKVQETKSISFYIVPDKCYVIGSRSTLGDWGSSTLNDMDNLTLSVLSGQVN